MDSVRTTRQTGGVPSPLKPGTASFLLMSGNVGRGYASLEIIGTSISTHCKEPSGFFDLPLHL